MTLGSLFDGIGGFPLAAVRNGITPVWASEIEPFPISVTKHHFPEMIHIGDITKLNGTELPPVDIICGGSLCQDYAKETELCKAPHNSVAIPCVEYLLRRIFAGGVQNLHLS